MSRWQTFGAGGLLLVATGCGLAIGLGSLERVDCVGASCDGVDGSLIGPDGARIDGGIGFDSGAPGEGGPGNDGGGGLDGGRDGGGDADTGVARPETVGLVCRGVSCSSECCFPPDGGTPSCGGCPVNDAGNTVGNGLRCDDDRECPNATEVCCWDGERARCEAQCDVRDTILCGAGVCPPGMACFPSALLDAGFGECRRFP